jgi:hypothetical protein
LYLINSQSAVYKTFWHRPSHIEGNSVNSYLQINLLLRSSQPA